MKNLKFYMDPNEINSFIETHFRTEEMRAAIQNQKLLRGLMTAFCRFPRLTFEASNTDMERGNFTSWYNALEVREYENPAVNDLFYLHEITHIATMPYLPKAGFDEWKRKIFKNELEASVMSEAFIYFLCPALRDLSFKDEIWVDRFISKLSGQNPDSIFNTLLNERDRVQREPNDSDPQEQRIHSYRQQNEEWTCIWKSRYLEVERHMKSFYEAATRTPKQAALTHQKWIETEIANSSGTPYPFAAEVEEFAALCAQTKTVVNEELKLKTK